MIQKLFSIQDVKTGIHYPPQAFINAAHATRGHMEIFVGQNQFAKFPADYNVVQIGEYDDMTGEIMPGQKTFLATGADLVAEYKKIKEG